MSSVDRGRQLLAGGPGRAAVIESGYSWAGVRDRQLSRLANSAHRDTEPVERGTGVPRRVRKVIRKITISTEEALHSIENGDNATHLFGEVALHPFDDLPSFDRRVL